MRNIEKKELKARSLRSSSPYRTPNQSNVLLLSMPKNNARGQIFVFLMMNLGIMSLLLFTYSENAHNLSYVENSSSVLPTSRSTALTGEAPLLFGITDLESLRNHTDRRERFPSIEERIKVYMSAWYEPRCFSKSLDPKIYFKYATDGDKASIFPWERTVALKANDRTIYNASNVIRPDTISLMDPTALAACAKAASSKPSEVEKKNMDRYHMMRSMARYCQDAENILMQHLGSDTEVLMQKFHFPLLASFGDTSLKSWTPFLTKIRSSVFPSATSTCHCHADENQKRTHEGIIVQIEKDRHFGGVWKVPQFDIPWEEKKNVALFRGGSTGAFRLMRHPNKEQLNDEEKCSLVPRCFAVLKHHKSPLVDARISDIVPKGLLPDEIVKADGTVVALTAPGMNLQEQLKFKGLIVLEGNDVATGLKWALYSNSVVLMPPPTRTSWAMEELLVPWKHYIPIYPDASDAEEKMQWVIDHDNEAREIALHATLWMEDMMFHPDAQYDDHLINQQILRRYFANFALDSNIESDGALR